MRNLVLALLLVNLAFFAYAAWIDQPAPSPADAAPALPRLMLASEFPQPPAASANGFAAPAEAELRDAHGTTIAESGVGQSRTVQARAASGVQAADSGASCIAIGPFDNTDGATHAASVLKGRGFEPRQRGEPGQVTEGYWVHVENIPTIAEQSRVMRSLEQAGLNDASPMQSADQMRHISVGIFSERGRAERRASAVKRLGIEAQVSPRKHPGTVYWLEMQAKAESNAVSTEGIVPTNGDPIEIRACNAPPVAAPTAKR